jgi:hypothetical protein
MRRRRGQAHASRQSVRHIRLPKEPAAISIIPGFAAVRFLWDDTLGRPRRFLPSLGLFATGTEAARRQGKGTLPGTMATEVATA